MLFLKAIILGFIEGITEFLPISSTGHLIIVNEVINFTGKFAKIFDVVIQVGAILAVIIYFRKKLIPNLKNKEEATKTIDLWKKVCVGFLPAAVLGLLLDDWIEEHLFNVPTVAMALIVGGILLLYVELRKEKIKVTSENNITYTQAFLVGVSQCFAMWPGMSRSGSTMIGGRLLGFSREVAVEFSFFLAVPTLLGASVLKLVKNGLNFSQQEYVLLLIGTFVSFIVAWVVIAMFMKYIKTKTLSVFAYYRIILGLSLIFYFKDIIKILETVISNLK